MNDTPSKLASDGLELARRIISVKIRMLSEYPFFGLLAQNTKLSIDPDVNTACTDGETIYFGQDFSKSIGDEELYFVFMHELLHIVYKHCFRAEGLNNYLYNIAADIVINSVLLDELRLDDIFIDGCPLMHTTPENEEGRNYTAEEVYAMLLKEEEKYAGKSNHSKEKEGDDKNKRGNGGNSNQNNSDFTENQNGYGIADDCFFDDHSRWGTSEANENNEASWEQRIYDVVRILESSNQCNSVPMLARRMVEDIQNPPIDWRSVLNNFIQQDVFDYSFTPPDRRYADSGFFLPDFNEKDDRVEDIWIAVDSSGSISDKQLTMALNEVKSAIEQYNGKFKGWISFFDYFVTKPEPFESVEDIKSLNLYGGGGTSFENIFKAREKYFDEDLFCIIIITDGYAPWPDESVTNGTPVLWLFNNLKVTPPWGMVARMNIKDRN